MALRLSYLEKDQVSQLIDRALQLRDRSKGKGTETNVSLDTWVERVMRKDEREYGSSDTHVSGTVVAVTAQTCTVEPLVPTSHGPIWSRLLSQSVVVGDQVTVGRSPSGDWGVVRVEPRQTKLSRPDVHEVGKERVIVANIDVIVIVVSVVSPPLHPRLIDRYLVAIQQGGAAPLVCVNKIDLLVDEAELEALNPYRELGIPLVTCSTVSSHGLDDLRRELQGTMCAFVGHSGVGKSSLVNALMPEAELVVGAVSEGYGRGTHTTTASSLHRLGDGTVLIDTPGIRSFGLRELSRREVAAYFPEFEGFACKFRNCSHLHEPECGVLAAVESGQVDAARYDSYRRLLADSPA